MTKEEIKRELKDWIEVAEETKVPYSPDSTLGQYQAGYSDGMVYLANMLLFQIDHM